MHLRHFYLNLMVGLGCVCSLHAQDKLKADATWWSLQPLGQNEPPQPAGLPTAWSSHPVDRFVYAKLAEKGLEPNPPASRAVLLRRLSYDLVGLPPTPKEIEAFEKDDSADAYEKQVERLLASPHYGEHWGRHWLDVVRFGESNGYERNVLIPNVWPFRDYVIRSLNEDRPFSQLVLEHLAGDQVAKGTDREIGTTFLVCGPYDNVGNSDPVQAALIRANHTDEIIRASSEAFLGLTFGCARCHDHKFDPITQRDYYALYTTFAGVRHAPRQVQHRGPGSDQPKELPAWAGKFEPTPGTTPIFRGGDPQKKGEAVSAASLSILDTLPSRYRSPENATEAERRLAWAKWLIAPDNPLTPRVLANRLWHYHFGVGIVASPSDFGWMGEKPTHPELLAWLASELQRHDWRLKPMHRLLVTSQTYRQSATWRAEAGKLDADARLLWRFPPRRLTGEEVRDTMLLLAGRLEVNKMGGPGFLLYKYVQDNVATYHPLDRPGPETYRRAVYHQNARAARVDVLSDFDCPDPAFAAPRRSATTTPLQALALLNHRFTHDQARALADRVLREAGDEKTQQIQHAFRLAFHRSARPDEVQRTLPIVTEHGLPVLCLALFNANEFLYLP